MIPRAMLAVMYATGRAYHARQVKGDDLDKKGYPGPTVWGMGVRPTTSPRKNNTVTKPQGNEAGRIHETIHEDLRLRTRNILELTLWPWSWKSQF